MPLVRDAPAGPGFTPIRVVADPCDPGGVSAPGGFDAATPDGASRAEAFDDRSTRSHGPSRVEASDDRPTAPIPTVRAARPTPDPGYDTSIADPGPGETGAGATVVTRTPDGVPRLTRRRDGALLGGVAGGVADHLQVPATWVRATFAFLALISGAGVLAYALLWIFVPQAPRPPAGATAEPTRTGRSERRQALGIAAVGAALFLAAVGLGLEHVLGWVLGPLGLAAVGAAFIWREADDARRRRWRRSAAGLVAPGGSSWWRILGGCVLVIGGLAVFALGQLDFLAVRSALIAVLLTLVGVAIITVPWWLRLVRDLGDERRERVRERERAEIAAHLHDSVLQTLALIQRQAGDAREVQRLARSQERQLRTWLYGPAGYASPSGAGPAGPSGTLAGALAEAAGAVEDTYAMSVTPVVVGDAPMDEHLAALVAAAREAMVNAAKHAGVQQISVYGEVEDDTASIFVRDRGAGFDPAAVDPDRRGLAESIHGRMTRHGGTASVRSTPGAGTEVELTMRIRSVAEAEDDPAAASGPGGTVGAAGRPGPSPRREDAHR